MKQIMKLTMVGLFCLGLSTACEDYPAPKPFAPKVTTGEADNLYRKGGTLYGSYDTSAGDQVKEVGIMVSIVRSMAEPTTLSANVGESNYSVQVTGLEPNREYFYQAYVSSGISTATGEVKSFTTPSTNAPVFSELKLMDVVDGNPVIGTSLLDNGGLEISMQGFCWKALSAGDASNPTIDDNLINISLSEMERYTLKGLLPNTTYAIRAWGNNGTVGYSNTVTFQTGEQTSVPDVQTSVINIYGTVESAYDFAHYNLALYKQSIIYTTLGLTPEQMAEKLQHSSEGVVEGKICIRLRQKDGSYSYEDNVGGELGGFWCDANGDLQGWGDNARTYTKLHSIYNMEVGFMPGTLTAGETYQQVIEFVYMLNGVEKIMTLYFNFIIKGNSAFGSYIYVPGEHQGWKPDTAPALHSPNSSGVYKGFSYLNGDFKFLKERSWGDEYNSNNFNTYIGAVRASDDTNINCYAEGYYRVVADVANGLLIITESSWSIIGDFNNWSDTDMAYNKEEDCWEVSVKFSDVGFFKFRANHDEEISVGSDMADLTENGGNLIVSEAGTYVVKLYLSRNNSDNRMYCTMDRIVVAPTLSELKLVDIVEGNPVLSTSLADNGGRKVSASGFCWKVASVGDTDEPTVSDEVVSVSLSEMERYTLKGLQPTTTYAIRAWANNGDVGYSNTLTVETDDYGKVIFNGEINPWGEPETK